MTRLRIRGEPDQIAGVRDVRASYHASWPTGVPQSFSSWRLRGVILATSCLRLDLATLEWATGLATGF